MSDSETSDSELSSSSSSSSAETRRLNSSLARSYASSRRPLARHTALVGSRSTGKTTDPPRLAQRARLRRAPPARGSRAPRRTHHAADVPGLRAGTSAASVRPASGSAAAVVPPSPSAASTSPRGCRTRVASGACRPPLASTTPYCVRLTSVVVTGAAVVLERWIRGGRVSSRRAPRPSRPCCSPASVVARDVSCCPKYSSSPPSSSHTRARRSHGRRTFAGLLSSSA